MAAKYTPIPPLPVHHQVIPTPRLSTKGWMFLRGLALTSPNIDNTSCIQWNGGAFQASSMPWKMRACQKMIRNLLSWFGKLAKQMLPWSDNSISCRHHWTVTSLWMCNVPKYFFKWQISDSVHDIREDRVVPHNLLCCCSHNGSCQILIFSPARTRLGSLNQRYGAEASLAGRWSKIQGPLHREKILVWSSHVVLFHVGGSSIFCILFLSIGSTIYSIMDINHLCQALSRKT